MHSSNFLLRGIRWIKETDSDPLEQDSGAKMVRDVLLGGPVQPEPFFEPSSGGGHIHTPESEELNHSSIQQNA